MKKIKKKKPRVTQQTVTGIEYSFRGSMRLLYNTLPPTWPWYKKAWHAWLASWLTTFAEQRAYLVSKLQGHAAKENTVSNASSMEAYRKP